MSRNFTAQEFVQLLKARVGRCNSIQPDDRFVPAKPDAGRKIWVAMREPEMGGGALIEHELADKPFRLASGGEISLYVRIKEAQNKTIDIVSYRIRVRVPPNANGITSLRFENDCSGRGGTGWDNELQDNPEHPLNHLHINYLNGAEANHCRMPTGDVCPIVLLMAIDFWYCATIS